MIKVKSYQGTYARNNREMTNGGDKLTLGSSLVENEENYTPSKYQSMRIWPMLMFNHGRQFMIVKTWETKDKNKEDKKSHIKTLRFYNNQFQELMGIYVEHIDGFEP